MPILTLGAAGVHKMSRTGARNAEPGILAPCAAARLVFLALQAIKAE